MQSRFLERPAAVVGHTSAAGNGGDVEHIVGPYYSNLPGLPFGMSNIANVGNTGAYFPSSKSCNITYVYMICPLSRDSHAQIVSFVQPLMRYIYVCSQYLDQNSPH